MMISVLSFFQVCFLNECTRETYWNIGREGFGLVAEKRPEIISKLVKFIDRNLESLESVGKNLKSLGAVQ